MIVSYNSSDFDGLYNTGSINYGMKGGMIYLLRISLLLIDSNHGWLKTSSTSSM